MTNQRDMFKKALFEAMSEKYESELSNIDSERKMICSKKHYLKLSAILGFKVNQNKKFSVRLLIGILIAALILTGCTAYVYKNEIKEFFIKIHKNRIELTYDNDSKTTMGDNVINPYQAAYIPEGYKLINKSKTPLHAAYEWRDLNGNVIILEQKVFDSTDIYFNLQDSTTEIINHNEYKIYCVKFDNSFYYVWNDGKYMLKLKSTVEFPQDELFKIIEGFK